MLNTFRKTKAAIEQVQRTLVNVRKEALALRKAINARYEREQVSKIRAKLK